MIYIRVNRSKNLTLCSIKQKTSSFNLFYVPGSGVTFIYSFFLDIYKFLEEICRLTGSPISMFCSIFWGPLNFQHLLGSPTEHVFVLKTWLVPNYYELDREIFLIKLSNSNYFWIDTPKFNLFNQLTKKFGQLGLMHGIGTFLT